VHLNFCKIKIVYLTILLLHLVHLDFVLNLPFLYARTSALMLYCLHRGLRRTWE